MDHFKKPHPKQPEPDSQIPTRQEDPEPMKPQNEEPEKHQVGHQIARGETASRAGTRGNRDTATKAKAAFNLRLAPTMQRG